MTKPSPYSKKRYDIVVDDEYWATVSVQLRDDKPKNVLKKALLLFPQLVKKNFEIVNFPYIKCV